MDNSSPQRFIKEIEALLERRRIPQVKMRLREALQHYPDHSGLILQSAWADYFDNDSGSGSALVAVQNVLTRDPENQSARLLLFELLKEKNELGKAEQIILQLLREYPEHAPYYGLYSNLTIRAMQFSKARSLAQEGLKYDPDDRGCLAAYSLCDLIDNRSKETARSLQQLTANHPQALRTLSLTLANLQSRGRHREAYRIAQEMLRTQPDNQDIVEIASELKAVTHWSMLPLWPIARWGWPAAIGIWFGGLVLIGAIGEVYPNAKGVLAICLIVYAIYSWVWPPLLRRWIAKA